MMTQKPPFTLINLNKTESKSSPITIFPRQVAFQDVISNNCYQIDLYVRNQSIQVQKIRIINPSSKHFKIKTEEGNIKNLAQGLAYKISVYFCCDKIESQDCLEDNVYVCGSSFKEQILLRAYAPRGQLIFPEQFNLGRLIAGIDNFRNIPLKNTGKAEILINSQCSSTSVTIMNENFKLCPGKSEKIELRLRNKKTGPLQQRIKISKDKQCVINGVFVEEYVQFLSQDGDKLMMMDFGQIFIGEKVEETFYIANNSENKVQMICKTFSKNSQMGDFKVDQQRGTFIIKSAPEQYAKDLKTCYSCLSSQKQTLKPFSSTQNKLMIHKSPTMNQVKRFNCYAFGLISQQIQQQPIIETLVINTSISKHIAKIPIKFISVFPRLKINTKVFQFGEIKERNDAVKTITLTNDGEKDIHLTIQHPENVVIEGQRVIKGHHSQVLNVRLHSVKVGKVSQIIKFKLFQGLQLEVKVFATCRSTSIRAKKIANLNSSRELKTGLFETLSSSRQGDTQRKMMNSTMKSNRTDYLMDLRTARLNNLLQEQIQSEKQPPSKEPKLNLAHSLSLNNLLRPNKSTNLRKITRQQKLTIKQMINLCKPLTVDQLQNIQIKQTELQLGNIFVENLVTRMVTVINKNPEPIIIQFETANNQTLFQTSCEPRKIDSFSQGSFPINFRPNSLGAVSILLGYVINRHHTFQMSITAYITLVNIEMSKKSIEVSFGYEDMSFQKYQEVQITNVSTTAITYVVKFQEGKHFYVQHDDLQLQPNSKTKLKVFYRPIQGDQTGMQRVDVDKMIIKVVGGAQNVVKCVGNVNDAKFAIKQNEISCLNHIVTLPFIGKLSLKNYSKTQGIYKFEIPSELSQIISFDKQSNTLSGEEKRQVTYTITCAQPKEINTFITLHVRGGRSTKILVDCSFVLPQIQKNKDILDFGFIPLLGNNYIQTLLLKNLHRNEIKLEVSKKSDCEDYTIQIKQVQRSKQIEEMGESQFRLKKRGTNKQQFKDKKITNTQKIIRLLPNVQTTLEIKFIPKKINQFDISIPLKLFGTNHQMQPIKVQLQCTSIQPIVYLHPQKVQFQKKIIGEGKNSFMKFFQIRNPHDYQIGWVIEPVQLQKTTCFYMSQSNGILGPHESVRVQVIFKPQQQGFFSQKYNVILHYKKTSLICLSFQGNSVFPCLKFKTNQIIMPPVPLKVQSRAFVILQNHGYQAINISKWKTSSHFQMVQLNVNFVEGKLLSVAKKYIKIEIVCSAQSVISFTTFLQLYDQFGVKYEIPLSCTFQNSLMTNFNFVEGLAPKEIIYNKKQNSIKVAEQSANFLEQNQINSTNLSFSLQFIKNWLNYELNLGLKSFPDCLVESQGQLFSKMINKISGCDLVKKFQSQSTQTHTTNLYSYYSECIRMLKLQGAFLNQIRPQYLLSYKQYKNYICSKNLYFQTQEKFRNHSIKSWMTIFYQLIKLFFLNSLTQKMLSKLTSSPSLHSSIYSTQEINIFRFLNSYLTEQFIFNFTDKIKIFQVLQKSLEKTFNVNLTASTQSLKISNLSMTNDHYLIAFARFLYQKLKQYGLCSFLSLSDFYTMGAKEMVLFLVSFIVMISHYSLQTSICFDASIGDKVTKIIEIQNPSSKKSKYKIKFQGSEQFQIQQTELVLPIKGKNEVRVVYYCRQKKEEEAKLILVPIKQQNTNGLVQPLVFRITTSIISKITLKKIQITANLYEVTSVSLQAELPIDITQLSQFNVTINNSTDDLIPSFYCFQVLNRNLKSNKDKLDIKLVPLSLGYKYCRVCYKSPVYGEFNFQIIAKIQSPNLIKQIRLKQLKVSKQQIVSIDIPKQNEQLANALRFLNEHHCKLSEPTSKKSIIPNKYSISIVESSYISICQESSQITKLQLQGKDFIHVNLKCNFGKPFLEYSCTLMIKNQGTMDIRYYKLITSVAMKPKIVPITIKCKARQSVTTKIPIKNAPCGLILQKAAKQVIIHNFNPNIKQNTDLVVSFNPEWVLHQEMTLISQNHQTLEQVVYEISLIAQQPSFFDKIKLLGSSVFDKKTKIPINLNINEQFKVFTTSSRIKIENDNKLNPAKKSLMATILSGDEEKASIKLIKEQTGFFYWAQIEIINQKIQIFKTITLQENPIGCKKYLLQDLQLHNDYKLHYDQHNNLKCSVINEKGGRWLSFEFKPIKQTEFIHKIYLLNKQREYQIDIHCKASPLPSIQLPEITSYNKNIKTTIVNVLNSSQHKGTYKATIQPQAIFGLDCHQFEIKAKQKKQLKILFHPESLQTKYKGSLILQSDILPTYQYNFTAISQFSKWEKTVQCEYYSDRDTLKDIYFTNPFSKTEDFIIQTQFKDSPFQLVEPTTKKFSLQAGVSKKLIIKASCTSKKQSGNGRLFLRMENKIWEYNLVSLQIKNLASKKISWSCTARQIVYDIIDLPQSIKIKSIESPPQISPYLTFTTIQGTNNIKLKYCPLKPLAKQQYQIFLITESAKYVVNSTVSVALPDYDDTIFIKTKQINEVGCISFKLTNTKKASVPFKAYFLKGQTDFTVEVQKNILEAYGRIGTSIKIKFTSHVFNKKVEDELWVQTAEMLWRFKVKGMLSKVILNK